MSRRIARVNELLLQEISRIVLERQHPDVGFVTFLAVETTEDLLQARVYYSVLGSDDEKRRTAAALKALRSEIFRGMRRLESLRYIPQFDFVMDDTPARAARVAELLDHIHHEEAPGAPAATPLPPAEPLPEPRPRKPSKRKS